MRGLLPYLGTGLLGLAAVSEFSIALKTGSTQAALPELSAASTNQAAASESTLFLPQPRPEVYYRAITDRPLFAPTRRPFVEAPVEEVVEEAPVEITEPAPEPVKPPPPKVALMGAMGGEDGMIALLKFNDDEDQWVSVGTNIGGWKLTTVTPTWVELTDGDTQIRVEMFE